MDASVFSTVNYIQKTPACVLGSYAVAAYSFVKFPILNFFIAYCKHHGIDDADPEKSYACHFHKAWNTLRVGGYSLIYNLHLSSTHDIFSNCRQVFSLQMIEDVTAEKADLEGFLQQNKQAMATVFINNLGHSITIGYDNDGFYKYDLNVGHVERNFQTISDLGILGNGFKLQGLIGNRCI